MEKSSSFTEKNGLLSSSYSPVYLDPFLRGNRCCHGVQLFSDLSFSSSQAHTHTLHPSSHSHHQFSTLSTDFLFKMWILAVLPPPVHLSSLHFAILHSVIEPQHGECLNTHPHTLGQLRISQLSLYLVIVGLLNYVSSLCLYLHIGSTL